MTVKIDKFSGQPGADFNTWWYLYEYVLEEQEITEESQRVGRMIVHLSGPALNWFASLKRDNRLPRTLNDLKRQMARRFDTSAAIKMKDDDLDGYTQGIDRIIDLAVGISEEDKKAIFTEGLSDSLYPHLIGFKGSYAEAKEFATKIFERQRPSGNILSGFRVSTSRAKRENLAPRSRPFDGNCYICRQPGHKKYDCPKLKELTEKEKPALKASD